MKYLYPVAIELGDEKTAYSVWFPDLDGCFTAGDTYDEALINAPDAIDMYLEDLADNGKTPPTPTKIEAHINDPEYVGFLWSIVDIDVSPYMGGTVKIDVNLPRLLLKKIDSFVQFSDEYKDRYHFLQVAALKEIEAATAKSRMDFEEKICK
ncbi:type II toxin-antitoxin system HicB family antitoxin [Photobacterium carnosum]|uniref:type II toxin-antitoxin system HicB family antitoxin n=1 Tax=Photobacterium carnosum TaxID=2023717 RepID=UPI001E569E21|nr:type II toxin-antitoxin system HicB family antitoxin [Photobacterium carnosum]MCD9528341.1 type II toxin-antitoxin system HicB family antitoxin [Photobacterium carnosum]